MTKPREDWNWWERNGGWAILGPIVIATAVRDANHDKEIG